ncbi:lysostaphin resistance A-like protein [Colwellia sp. RE-S-Sl-9]
MYSLDRKLNKLIHINRILNTGINNFIPFVLYLSFGWLFIILISSYTLVFFDVLTLNITNRFNELDLFKFKYFSFIAPIVETIIFQFFLQNILRRGFKSVTLSVVLTAVLFNLAHLTSSFTNFITTIGLITSLVLIFEFVRYKHGQLWAVLITAVSHILWNISVVLFSYFIFIESDKKMIIEEVYNLTELPYELCASKDKENFNLSIQKFHKKYPDLIRLYHESEHLNFLRRRYDTGIEKSTDKPISELSNNCLLYQRTLDTYSSYIDDRVTQWVITLRQ